MKLRERIGFRLAALFICLFGRDLFFVQNTLVYKIEALTNKPCEIQTKPMTVKSDSCSLLAGIVNQFIMCVSEMETIREEKDVC